VVKLQVVKLQVVIQATSDAPGVDKKGLPSMREALLKKDGLYYHNIQKIYKIEKLKELQVLEKIKKQH
jgi:hydroxymethylpyrimidine/phosphomethylpyrimidine kinase